MSRTQMFAPLVHTVDEALDWKTSEEHHVNNTQRCMPGTHQAYSVTGRQMANDCKPDIKMFQAPTDTRRCKWPAPGEIGSLSLKYNLHLPSLGYKVYSHRPKRVVSLLQRRDDFYGPPRGLSMQLSGQRQKVDHLQLEQLIMINAAP